MRATGRPPIIVWSLAAQRHQLSSEHTVIRVPYINDCVTSEGRLIT